MAHGSADTPIEEQVPSAEFLGNCEPCVLGKTTSDEMVVAKLARVLEADRIAAKLHRLKGWHASLLILVLWPGR